MNKKNQKKKIVVIGGSGLERWDWPLSFMDLEWHMVAPQTLNDTNDRYVGKYDPETKIFKPAAPNILGFKGSREFEREFFTSEKGTKLISQQLISCNRKF